MTYNEQKHILLSKWDRKEIHNEMRLKKGLIKGYMYMVYNSMYVIWSF